MGETIDDMEMLDPTEISDGTENKMSAQQPEPSYAYLLDKDKERLCRKDLTYCTWDKDGNPIPFCFEYPNDEKCTSSPPKPSNLLFMGCYDDPTCGGKPVGKIKIKSKDPPFAYTTDGKCEKSSTLCVWLTNEIAVPRCAKEGNTAQCRDRTDDLLIGCYTEETCGGNVMKKIFGPDVNSSSSKADQPVQKETITTKNKMPTPVLMLLVVLLPMVLVLISLLVFYLYRKKTKKRVQKPKQQFLKKIRNRFKKSNTK